MNCLIDGCHDRKIRAERGGDETLDLKRDFVGESI